MVDQLLAQDKAYKCYASKELLDEIRAEQEANKEMARYDANHPKIKAVNEAAKGVILALFVSVTRKKAA